MFLSAHNPLLELPLCLVSAGHFRYGPRTRCGPHKPGGAAGSGSQPFIPCLSCLSVSCPQAISAMVRARDADPTNLEVLLALGVSHTNELEQTEALSYLRGWLQHHPKYGASVSAAPPEALERLTHAEVARLFTEASQASPADADLHTVLGVLFNLSREYDRAIESFRRALSLQPQDYSLWNKLGATQANSTQSSEAIDAYQKALDLKPNYVRAWSNMGIGYANQGRYEESLPFYVRALAMNPRAENAWQYLRISLSCAGHAELLGACDRHDLEALKTAFPM
eukprot:TRINITY_DN1411_c0_g1_i1.p1 TRINITY_DN1411_c0_g1~~TRINITY_DN1411_c0_g1_i1.p1  ORF type:complete len:282 (+),score=43.74 TRINITY_DN1411_c0_g1_i1:409-1254(+)